MWTEFAAPSNAIVGIKARSIGLSTGGRLAAGVAGGASIAGLVRWQREFVA